MPNTDNPDVSVLLAVHNGARYLERSMRSVMAQTLRNIEIIVVDDASSDASPDILKQLASEDPRIRIVTQKENLRLAGTLNHGLTHVQAPYVARMDDDDIAYPERLEVQKRFLDTHPDIYLAAASIDWIDAEGAVLRRSVRPRDSFAIRWLARFSMSSSHPTFMFRRSLSDGSRPSYDPDRHLTEDHDLICRLLQKGEKVVCLPDVLLAYRFHAGSVSRRRTEEQAREAREICEAFQKAELPDHVVQALAPVRDLYFDFAPPTPERAKAAFAGMRAMLAHDLSQAPERGTWLRRQSAQHLAWSLQRAGASGTATLRAFLRHGPDLLPALALRKLETKRALGRLGSEPEIW